MARKFYTIDDLYDFCKDNRFEKFNSAEHGAPLVIQSIGTFASEDKVVDGLLPVTLKSCHTGKNANRSGISDSTMKECKQSFQGRPILGAIYKTDTGEYEFRSHDMKIVQDDDGNTEIEYIEQPIGVISQTEDPYLEFDEELDKNFLMVKGTIFADYSKAAEWYQKAADQGYARAQFGLGVCYDWGKSVVKNSNEAVKWYRKAADQGHTNAQWNLGVSYEYGDGADQDWQAAAMWYQKVAEQGDAKAQMKMARCYREGLGVPVDEEKAKYWEERYKKNPDK